MSNKKRKKDRMYVNQSAVTVLRNVGNKFHRPCLEIFKETNFLSPVIRSLPVAPIVPRNMLKPTVWLLINLRDPVRRVLSQYSHNVKSKKEHDCCGTPNAVRVLSGEAILAKGIDWFIEQPGIDNVQVRMAANIGWDFGRAQSLRLKDPGRALHLAIKALHRTHGIYIVERGECSFKLACERLLGPGKCVHHFVGHKNVRDDSLAHSTDVAGNTTAGEVSSLGTIKARILELNDADVRLYAEANAEIDRRIALQPHGWKCS